MEDTGLNVSTAQKMGQQFCTYCGSKLTPGTKFCTNCGAPVKEEAGEAAYAAEPEPQGVNSFAGEENSAGETEEQSPFSPYLQNGAETPEQDTDSPDTQTSGYSHTSQNYGQQFNTGAYAGGGQTNFNDKGSGKITLHLAAILCYLFSFVGWIAAYFLGDRSNHFLRFHLNQALVLLLANAVLRLILPEDIRIFGEMFIFVLWCFGVFHAFRHEEKGVPILGKITLIR